MSRLRLSPTLLMIGLLLSLLRPAYALDPLAMGATAPAISSTDQNGQPVDLGQVYKTGYVLVYFYPKAGTPGCTKEACSLRDAFADLSKEKLTIIGVSHDTVAEQKKFTDDQKLPFTLLADPNGDVYKAFGVPSMRNRQSFLLKNGVVVWRELKASTSQQAADVKKALAAAQSPAPAAPAAVSS
jgi:thioredoxin-dependent peroxiredoxin